MAAMPKRARESVAIFTVSGMGTQGRAQKVKRKIGGLDGVLSVEVNYVLDAVSIMYDANKLTLGRIKREIGNRVDNLSSKSSG